MRSVWSAVGLVLLTTAAAGSGRNASHYFQRRASRPQDAVVFFTATAPPLVCELEAPADWAGGNRLKADFILAVPRAASYYTCSFQGNGTTATNLRLMQTSAPGAFTVRDPQKVDFSDARLTCLTDSQLPDEYFQLQIQRPNEERTVKCRHSDLEARLFLRFPGYPTIICPVYSNGHFRLPGVVGNQYHCGFQVLVDLQRIGDDHTEDRLYQSLVRRLPTREDGGRPNVLCVTRARPPGSYHFQVRLPGDMLYDCRFSDS